MVKIREQDIDNRDYSQFKNYKYFHSFPNMIYHSDKLSIGDICVIHDEWGRTISLFKICESGLKLNGSLFFRPHPQSCLPRAKVMGYAVKRAIWVMKCG